MFKQLALALINKGIPVIPVQPREKRCTLSNWQNLATTDLNQIEEWNAENPNYNVGAVAKPDGIWILDTDNPGLSSHIENHTGKEFPSTFMVKSAKGYHYYFLQTDASRVMGNVQLKAMFDAQQSNKYVVGAGSIHPSGVRYTVLDDQDLIPAPDWLCEWVAKQRTKTTNITQTFTPPVEVDVKAELKSKVMWMANFLKESTATVYSKGPVKFDNGYKIYVECPNSDEHYDDNGPSQTAILIMPGMGYDFKCQHSHCAEYDWSWFRRQVEDTEAFAGFAVEDVTEVESEEGNADEVVAEVDEEEIPPAIVGEINLTNSGNAKRLVSYEGHNIKYCHSKKKWYVWSGRRWMEDDRGVIYRKAERVVQTAIMTEAKQKILGMEDEDKTGEVLDLYRKFALASESKAALDAMVSLTKNQQGVPIRITDFDADPNLFNIWNGTVDLTTQDVMTAKRKNLCTKVSKVEFDSTAKCPQWLEFLNTIFSSNQEMIDYIQRCVGYSLTPETTEQCFFLMYGTGANGKSKLLEVLAYIFGDYAQNAQFDSFTVKQNEGIRNDLANLCGARLVMASEGDQNKRISEGVVKQITGEDKITARFLYGEEFSFKPTFKLWLATNHKPKVIGQDYGFWRRVRLIPFEVTIAKVKQDVHLGAKLKSEAAGILNWAFEGLKAWQDQGLNDPSEVLAATADYRNEEDVLQIFIDSECIIESGAVAAAAKLYAEYKRWAEDGSEYVMNSREFKKRLMEKGFSQPPRGSSGITWRGIRSRRVWANMDEEDRASEVVDSV